MYLFGVRGCAEGISCDSASSLPGWVCATNRGTTVNPWLQEDNQTMTRTARGRSLSKKDDVLGRHVLRNCGSQFMVLKALT
jgi:hypothetical protein